MSAQSEPKTFRDEWFLLVLALFFASGFSSLVYQVIWTRHLVLIFGSTTLATATVLAVFMGGLALGSFFAGRIAHKIEKPFLWYGILEGIIGFWALFVPVLLDIAVSSYRVIWELTHFDFFSFSLLRLALAAMILLLPTTLMGATLPLLSKYVTESVETVGNKIGTIYAFNTLGAVCGAAQAGLILLPTLGLNVTTMIAAGINLLLCLIVIGFSLKVERDDQLEEQKRKGEEMAAAAVASAKLAKERAEAEADAKANTAALKKAKKKNKNKGKKPSENETQEDAENLNATVSTATGANTVDLSEKEATEQGEAENAQTIQGSERVSENATEEKCLASSPGLVALALVSICISGAAAMIYEVCWTRTLSMIIGGSTYAFTVMLATFLSGIFLGSFLCAKFVDRIKHPYLAFGVLQILVAVGCLASLSMSRFLPEWNLLLNDRFPNALFSVWIRFLLAESVLLPLTLFLGALFPVVIKCTASNVKHIANDVGTVYSANTLGAIIGSVLAGFVLIPHFGVEETIVIATAVNVFIGALLIFAEREAKLQYKFVYATVGILVFCAFVFNPYKNADKKAFLLAQSARRALRDGYDVFGAKSDWKSTISRTTLNYYKDGPCSNVAVLKFAHGDKVGTYSLLTNGCVDASDGADMSQQVLLASFPMLFRPNARRACVIGWGSGVTVAELLNFPLATITAVELEPAVIEAARVFNRYTHSPEKNPRVKVEINDGRNFLLATTQKFDIIVSEPSNPWQVGVCNLFTEEYFGSVKDRLTPDGVLSLWLQLGEVSPDSVKSVMSALRNQFKYCLAMASDASNLVVLASEKPLEANYKNLQEAFKDPYITRALDKAKITNPEAVLARMWLTPKGVTYMVQNTKPNTDDLNQLEYKIGRTYESMTFGRANGVLLSENMGRPPSYVEWGNLPKDKIAGVMARVAMEATKFGHLTAAYSWARSSADEMPNKVAQRLLAWLEEEDKKQNNGKQTDEKGSTPDTKPQPVEKEISGK